MQLYTWQMRQIKNNISPASAGFFLIRAISPLLTYILVDLVVQTHDQHSRTQRYSALKAKRYLILHNSNYLGFPDSSLMYIFCTATFVRQNMHTNLRQKNFLCNDRFVIRVLPVRAGPIFPPPDKRSPPPSLLRRFFVLISL